MKTVHLHFLKYTTQQTYSLMPDYHLAVNTVMLTAVLLLLGAFEGKTVCSFVIWPTCNIQKNRMYCGSTIS